MHTFCCKFLKKQVFAYWQWYKLRTKCNSMVSIFWDDFKAFLQKNIGKSILFVDEIWSNIKRDSQYQLEKVQD